MAERKPLFMDQSEGFSEEMAQADSITLGGLTMGGIIDMGDNQITDVPTPTDPDHAVNKAYVDALASGLDVHEGVVAKTTEGLGTQALLAGVGGSGTITLTNETMDVRIDGEAGWTTITFSSPADITAVAAAINAQYGATIAAVNGTNIDLNGLVLGEISQVETQNVVAAITTQVGIINDSDVSGAGYTAVGTGVGKTLEALSDTTAANTIDGVLLEVADRVLVSMQGGADAVGHEDNGVYDVTVLGDGAGASFKMTRVTDADTAAAGEMAKGLYVFVSGGSSYENTGWSQVLEVTTISTDPIQFSQFSGAPGLTYDQGILKDVNSIQVELDTDADAATTGAGGGSSGLEFDVDTASGQLRVRVSPTGGIDRLADGIGVDLDGTTLQLDNGGAGTGLSVKGLPAQFEIATVAVSANVTGANLDTLTAGAASDADALHTHDGLSSTSHTHAHSEITGVGTDDHHAESHTIASHSDTSATGAELDTLTDGSNADALHVHASAIATEAPKVENTFTTATDAIAVGDPVYINGVDTFGKALASTAVTARVIGINRLGAGAAPQSIEVVSHGPCTSVLTGATAGTPYYLAAAGGLTTTLPGGGSRIVLMGYALNATDLFVDIRDYGKKAA